MSDIPNILSIAGSDPSGGAGIQADLKTFSALGCYGMAAITALTAQNTRGVSGVHMVPPKFLHDQLTALFEDCRIDAVKIGMAGTSDSISVIANILKKYEPSHIILDPVMVATSGDVLLPNDALAAMKSELVPLASVVTPNIPEGEILAGYSFDDFGRDISAMVRALYSIYSVPVLLKGGHLGNDMSVDALCSGENDTKNFEAFRIDTQNTHGTGCTLSSAIAAYLGRGFSLHDSVQKSKLYLTRALSSADILHVGAGAGPAHHFADLWSDAFSAAVSSSKAANE